MAEMTWCRFTEERIKNWAPNRAGVYQIDTATATIYVGKSAAIQDRLMAHLKKQTRQSRCTHRKEATLFRYSLVASEKERLEVEDRWIERFDPVCNRQ